MSDRELCIAMHPFVKDPSSSTAQAIRTEIDNRKLVRPGHWGTITQGKIGVGMSTCALYAVMGRPSRENRSVFGGTVRVQHVYSGYYAYIASYFYTENDVVTGWQD